MIIVRLSGGLGNQLFQYALGRALALKNNVCFKLDINSYRDDCLRVYELNNFNINVEFATEEDLQKVARNNYPERISDFIRQYLPFKSKNNIIKYIAEKKFSFDKNILTLEDNIYLSGYWQSPEYFSDIRAVLLKEFMPKRSLKGYNHDIAIDMAMKNSVAIHIRRGDYVSNAVTNEFHGLCGLEYYYKCIANIAKMIKNPTFYVFSDDIDWCKEHLKIDYSVEFVNYNQGEMAFEDLRLMSLCKHNIIANSSFSWWGAWLNQNDNKIVFAPQQWFSSYKADTKDLIPANWIKL